MLAPDYFLYAWIAIAVFTFFYLLKFKTAPYGRHSTTSWGPMIPNKLGWFIMELPALTLFVYFFLKQEPSWSIAIIFIFGAWVLHYFNRTIIFPLRIKTDGKQMPLVITFSAIIFNLVNTWIVGSYLGANASKFDLNWMQTPFFIVGISLFIIGFFMNQYADYKLIHLRKPGETDYKIPRGFLFDFISCPNLLGEIIEWIGFFIMTWSLPTFSFAIWTFANLAPRAISHHKWYLSRFPNYPKERKALIPFIW